MDTCRFFFTFLSIVWVMLLGPCTYLMHQSFLLDKASVTTVADFSPEINPPFRWRCKHQIKNHHAYQ